jgi:hypothetical protein
MKGPGGVMGKQIVHTLVLALSDKHSQQDAAGQA